MQIPSLGFGLACDTTNVAAIPRRNQDEDYGNAHPSRTQANSQMSFRKSMSFSEAVVKSRALRNRCCFCFSRRRKLQNFSQRLAGMNASAYKSTNSATEWEIPLRKRSVLRNGAMIWQSASLCRALLYPFCRPLSTCPGRSHSGPLPALIKEHLDGKENLISTVTRSAVGIGQRNAKNYGGLLDSAALIRVCFERNGFTVSR